MFAKPTHIQMSGMMFQVSAAIVELLATFLLLVMLVDGGSAVCPASWTLYSQKNRCIKIINDTVTYDDAIIFCRNEFDDGELVRIEDNDDSTFVTDLLMSHGQDVYWIGLDDRESDGVWKNGDCKRATWYNWLASQGQPNGDNTKPQHCVAIHFFWNVYKWHDKACDRQYYPICMRKVNATSVTSLMMFKKIDRKSTKTVKYATTVDNEKECVVLCSQFPHCMSLNLKKRSDEKYDCQLVDGPSASADATGWMYFSLCP